MMKLVVLLLVAVMAAVGCGKKEEPLADDPVNDDGGNSNNSFDTTQCPSGKWGLSDNINFTASGTLVFENFFCTSSGTYTCDSANRRVTLNITAQGAGSFASHCQGVGTYSCAYEYSRGRYNSIELLITCDGVSVNNKLNPTKTF